MTNPKSTAQILGHPLHPMLVPFPIAFLVGTFVADLAYGATSDPFWARGAFWLLAAALVTAALAGTAGFIDFMNERLIRAHSASWYHLAGNVTAVVVSLVNLFMRWINGTNSAYPGVMWLSLFVVLLLVFNGWKGWEMVYRDHVGVSDDVPYHPAE